MTETLFDKEGQSMGSKLKTPFKGILPPLSSDEFAALKADIAKHGVLHPVIVDDEGNILDGHHRYQISKSVETKLISGLTDAEKRAFVQSSNHKRRNLSPEQKAVMRQQMIETAKALKAEDAKKWTQARIATALGVARQTVTDWFEENISNAGPGKANNDARVSVPKSLLPDLVKRVESGEKQSQIAADFGISQSRVSQVATQERKRVENRTKVETITRQETKVDFDSLYDVIVIDPPWPMKKIDRDVRPNQSEFDYPTMSEDQLAEMVMPCAADCHLWLWTTHKFLPMAIRLLKAWDINYVCSFVWHKPGGFQPIGLPQYNCEFALYGRRGSPKFVDTKAFNTCFNAARGKHSEKPEAFYDVVRRVTGGKRIDIFNRREIEGFDRWGNES